MSASTATAVSLEALLAEVEARHIKLRLEGDRLRYAAPQGAVTPVLLAQLQAHKAEIIAWLRDPDPAVRLYPSSFAQRRFWTLQKQNPGDAFYNVPFAFRLCGPLDIDILRRSFQEIVRRHEVLRTTLQEMDGELIQTVAPTGEIHLKVMDAQGIPVEERANEIPGLLQTEMERPFELAQQTGLRVLLLQTDCEEYLLQLCLHNTLFDQNSVINLLKELSLHYTALLAGESAALPPPAQYVDYVRWQEALLASGMEERLEYWRKWFSYGEPPAWIWASAKPAPKSPGFHSHVPWQNWPPGLTQQLKALSQRNGVTLFMTLFSAYAMILREHTGCADITIGTTYSNRHDWQFASLIGATIDVPALRIDMTGNPSVEKLLGRVRSTVAAALTHQDVPFERITPQLQRPRPSAGPLFRVVFSFFPETPHGQLQLPGVTVTFLEEIINELSRPDLYLVIWENQTVAGGALAGYWMHKKDIFEAETAASMNDQLIAVLAAMVRDPAQTVDEALMRAH